MRSAARGALALAALAAGGCAQSDEGPVVYDPDLVSALLVEAHLDPGATRVMPFHETHPNNPFDGFLLGAGVTLAEGAGADGARLVNVVLSTSADRTVGNFNFEAWFALGPDGRLTPLTRPASAPPLVYDPRNPARRRWVAGVDGVDSGVVVECTPDEAAVFDLRDGALRARAASRALCTFSLVGPGLGPSALPGRVVRLTPETAAFRLEALDLASGAVVAARAVPRPVVGALPLWYEEVAEGRFFVLARDPDGGQLHAIEGDEPPRSVSLDGFLPTAARRVEGRVLLTNAEGDVAWWDPAGAAGLVRPAAEAAPAVFDAASWRFVGTPGAAFRLATGTSLYSDAVSVPLALFVQLPEGDGLRAEPGASTPCVDRERCRLYGESYPLAVFDVGPEPLGLYAFWAWTRELALYTAPVFRPDAAEGE